MALTNYPGSICIGIYKAISAAPAAFRIGWLCLFALNVLFLSAVTFLKMQYPERIDGMKRFKWLFSPTTFILALCAGVFILRIPNLVPPRLCVDEDQWIVTGIAYLRGAVLWKAVSGNTSGPLIFNLPLIMIPVDGLNYTTIRIFGLLACIIPAIYFTWKTLRLLYGDVAAQISVISAFIFFASINEGEFLAYNSEHVPMVLTALAIYFLFSMAYKQASAAKYAVLFGLVLGVMPYAKLQIMPAGMCLGLIGIFELAIQKEQAISLRARRIMILASAAVFPTFLVGIYLTVHHAWGDFWSIYIMNNLNYAMHKGANAQVFPVYSGIAKFTFVPWLLLKNHYLTKFVFAQIVIVLVLIALKLRPSNIKTLFSDRLVWYSILIAFSAYLSVSAPGNRFSHYIYLFIFPFIFVTGCLTGKLMSLRSQGPAPAWFIVAAPVLPCLIYIFVVLAKLPTTIGYEFVVSKQSLSASDESLAIRKYTHPGEWMSVWGWGIYSFVESDLVMANKTASPFCDMFNGDDPSLLDGFMKEIKAKKPVVFFDAMPVLTLRKENFRHENYPVLNDYVNQNYKEAGEYNGTRVYILNDRKKEVDALTMHQ